MTNPPRFADRRKRAEERKPKLVSRLRRRLEAYAAARRSRRILHDIASRDDHLLRDIGLTRHDVERALVLKPHEDPDRLLLRLNSRR